MSEDVDLHRAVRRLQEGQAQLTDSVIRIEHSLTALLEGQTSLVEGQTSLVEGQTSLVEGQRSLVEGQRSLVEGQRSLVEDQRSLVEDQRSLVEGQTSFRAAMVDELAKTRADIMERLDRQQNSLTDIRADIAVNAASTDSVRRFNENTRDDLRALWDVVTQLRLKIDRLENRVRDVTGDP